MFYLDLSQEKFSLVNIHAFVSLLVASLNTFKSVPFYYQLVESVKGLYYIDNLYGIDGIINGASSGEISRSIPPQLTFNVANYLSLVITNVDANTITPLETIINVALSGFNLYPEREANYSKIIRIFVDVLLMTSNVHIVKALCNFFTGRMSQIIANMLFSVDADRFEGFIRKAASSPQPEAFITNTLICAIGKSSPELVLKAFNSALKILRELLRNKGETQENQEIMTGTRNEASLPHYALQTYTLSLAFAGKRVPQLIAMLIEEGRTSSLARDTLCTVIGFISLSAPPKPKTFATRLLESPPPMKKFKVRLYTCRTCTSGFNNFMCCPDCAETCHKGHDLIISDERLMGPACMCCRDANNASCHRNAGPVTPSYENGIDFRAVSEFYDAEREKAPYMRELASFRNDLVAVLAMGVEGYPVPTEPCFTKDNGFFSNSRLNTKITTQMFNRYALGDKTIMPTVTPKELQTYFSPMCIIGDSLAVCSGSKIVFINVSNVKPTNVSLAQFTGTKEMSLKTLPQVMNICPHPVHASIFAANNANRCSVVLYNRNDFSVLKEASIFIEKSIRSVEWNKKAPWEICISTDEAVFIYDVEKSVQEPVRIIKLPFEAKFKGTAVVSCGGSSFIVIASTQSVYACELPGSEKELTCIIPDIGFEIYAVQYIEQLSSLVLSFGDNKKPIVLHVEVSKENGGQLAISKSAVLFRETLSFGGKNAPTHHFVAFPDTNPVIVGINPERDLVVGVTLCKAQEIHMIPLRDSIVGILALRKSAFEQYLILLTSTGRITYTQYHPFYLIDVNKKQNTQTLFY